MSGFALRVTRGSVRGDMESDGGIRGGGELEVGREAVKARMNIDAGLVQGGMEIDIETCRQRRREATASEFRVQVGALLGAIVIERNRPTNPMSSFDLLRSDSRSSSDVFASTTRHRYLLRPTPVVKQPPLMPVDMANASTV